MALATQAMREPWKDMDAGMFVASAGGHLLELAVSAVLFKIRGNVSRRRAQFVTE